MASELNELRILLAAAKQARLDLLKTGQEYAVVGAYSTKNMSLSDIEGLISRTERKILSRQGYRNKYSTPNFN